MMAVLLLALAPTSLLITPYAFDYDMTAVSAAMVWLFVGRLSIEREWRLVVWLAWLMPLLAMAPEIRVLGLRLTRPLGEGKDAELGPMPSPINAA